GVEPEMARGEIELRRRPHAGAHDVEPRRSQPFDHAGRELGRGEPPIPSHGDALAAAALDCGAEAAPDRARIARRQRLADDARDIVLAQARRIELVVLAHAFAPAPGFPEAGNDGRPIELYRKPASAMSFGS